MKAYYELCPRDAKVIKMTTFWSGLGLVRASTKDWIKSKEVMEERPSSEYRVLVEKGLNHRIHLLSIHRP